MFDPQKSHIFLLEFLRSRDYSSKMFDDEKNMFHCSTTT